jgi:hypothetical protein
LGVETGSTVTASAASSIDGKIKAIRRVSINSQPGLLPVDFAPDDIQGGRQSLETYQARAQLIREHSAFRQRIARLLADRYEDQAESTNVEERIYSGFPSYDDQALIGKPAGYSGNDYSRFVVALGLADPNPSLVDAMLPSQFRKVELNVPPPKVPDYIDTKDWT